jgi:hypothetical protein
MPTPRRGEVWLIDSGLVGESRPTQGGAGPCLAG